MDKGVGRICSQCGTAQCHVLEPIRVARDMAHLHAVIDYVLGEDLYANIRIRRDSDNEFFVQVECDDPDVAAKINFSPECNRGGFWFGASARKREPDDLEESDGDDEDDEDDDGRLELLVRLEPLDDADQLSPIARDYIADRADAAELLADMEAARLENIGLGDDEQERFGKFTKETHGTLTPGSFDGESEAELQLVEGIADALSTRYVSEREHLARLGMEPDTTEVEEDHDFDWTPASEAMQHLLAQLRARGWSSEEP